MDKTQAEKGQELLFGADIGDHTNMISESAMLGVVFYLFGNIDYIDP